MNILCLALLIVAATALVEARRKPKFPCHRYRVIQSGSDWPDGYRAKLNLPVVKAVKLMKKKMEGGDVIITFNKPITRLDAPQTDTSKQQVSDDGKTYSLFVKFPDKEFGNKKKGQTFTLDISVHHPRSMKRGFGIVGLQFGEFLCPPKPKLPECQIEMIDNAQVDGFQGTALVPLGDMKYENWKMEMRFSRPIFNMYIPESENAVKENPDARDVTVFKVHNVPDRAEGKGPIFRLEFIVHFNGEKVDKKDVKLSQIKFNDKVKCQAKDFSDKE